MATSYRIGDRVVSSAIYGMDFEPEYRRVMDKYVIPKTGHILEWGSGITSIMMSEHIAMISDVISFDTVESNREYFGAVKSALKDYKKTTIHYKDVNGPCESMKDTGLNYSTYPLSLNKTFDFIFIDGRRRLECALIASMLAHSDTVVVFHDYRRNRYQPSLALFDIIEDGPHFRVCRPNPVAIKLSEGRRHLFMPSFLELVF